MKYLKTLPVMKALVPATKRGDQIVMWKTSSENGIYVRKPKVCLWICYDRAREEHIVYVGVPEDIDSVSGGPVGMSFRNRKSFDSGDLQGALNFSVDFLMEN